MSLVTQPPRLLVKGISKTFGAAQVVKSVNLEVSAGEVHALIGENGAGKSTLTKMIAGVHRPDEGSISLDGEVFQFRTPAEAIKAGVSTVYQELNLIPELDCGANIALGSEPHRMLVPKERGIRRRAAKVLREVGSSAQPTTPVAQLATGEQQLVEIAKALASDAKIIIMDEPTAALSSGEVVNLHKAVRHLASRGISIIYITHKLSEVFDLANRVSVMRDGTLLTTLNTSETNRDELVATMLGGALKSQADAALTSADVFDRLAKSTSVLEVDKLSTSGQVKDVSFRVRAGEIVGFAGLVGAGRTELVRSLVGLERIVAGEIRLKGSRFRPSSPKQAQRSGVVMAPEDRKTQGLLLDQVIASNVTLPHLPALSKAGWINGAAVKAMAQACIEQFDVRPRNPEAITGQLSGGNQQKILIGRWLLKDFDVLIFDEPSKGVDVGARAGIWSMIRTAANKGAAVIVVSSETEELIALCHNILVMRQGRVSATLQNNSLSEEEVMTHAF